MLELIKRNEKFYPGYREYCREMYDAGVIYFRPMDPAYMDDGWFARTKPVYDRRETEPAPGQSRSFHYWAVDGERFIGEFQLRTEFTERVLTDIGSIGYAVRPSEWGRGRGTEILRLGLGIAKAKGMKRVLLTVNDENAVSAHVIEKLGGRLADIIEACSEAEGKHLLRRYWIEIS
ncbi:MAG: GNAT family N-acetyltransferase [Clostridia bacterium]|nr:GNAT family N-acetyltransferase [Clostridia bacterium]